MFTAQQLANLLGINCNEVAVIVADMGTTPNTTAEDYFREKNEMCIYPSVSNRIYMALYKASEEGTLKHKYLELLAETQTNYKELSELVRSLNWLDWFYSEKKEYCKASEVRKWWENADNFAFDTLHGAELDYFINYVD